MTADYIVRDYDVDNIRDAERLVKMYATFDSVWPGGFMNGAVPTPEHMMESMRRMQRLAICVVQYQDEMVGYCDLHAQSGNTDLAYIPLLGADPAHHGKGVGKALLLEMIRRVTTLGFRELTLGTWPGNMKAVPLYKKTGFNWEPESSVHMRNFLPGLLNSAPGKAFFAGKDWYACQDRVIEVAPDDVKWKGMRVFPYSFSAGNEYLKATFEMASGGMTALETNDYSIWCSIPTSDGEAPSGETLPITWHISPKSGKPIELMLLTEADDGLDVKVREIRRITESTEITREIRVLSNADPRHEGARERCVRSTLVLNGIPIVLETGVEVVRPISIEYSGQGLFPGREEKVEIRLKSNLDRPISGTLTLDPHPKIVGTGAGSEFTLPPRFATEVTFSLTGKEAGACLTNLRYEAEGIRGTRPLTFRVLGSITPVSSIETAFDEELIIESPGVKITQSLRGGLLSIKNKSAMHTVQVGMPEPGPPFASMRRSKLLLNGRVEERGADTTAIVRAEYPEFPGLIVERHVTQLAGDLISICYRVFNTTALNAPIKLRTGLRSMHSNYIALPTEHGIIREPRRDWDPFPMGGQDVLRSPDAMTESWLASESDKTVSGFIWHGDAQLEMDWNSGLTLDAGEISANSSVTMRPLYVVVGAGNWESVRGWWRKLVQPSTVKEKIPLQAKRVLQVHTKQTPLLLTEDETKVELLVDNCRGRAISASIAIESAGLEIEPAEFAFKDVNRDVSKRLPICIRESNGYGAGYIQAKLDSESNSQIFKLPVIRLSAPGAMSVVRESDGLYLVQNGVLNYRVAPEFLGAVTSLEADGVNHLHSSWPKPGSFVWTNPWYGGIHTYLDWIGADRLAREAFTGDPVTRDGETGLTWQGVRVTCEPKHRDLRWLKIETEYLTLPGSDLLAIAYRWSNLSNAKQYIYGGVAVWSAVGGDRTQSVAHWSKNGELRHRRRSSLGMDVDDIRWAAIENGVTRHRLEVVAAGTDAKAWIDDMSEEGAHIGVGGKTTLDAGESVENICWLVVNPAVSEFEAYGELNKLTNLP